MMPIGWITNPQVALNEMAVAALEKAQPATIESRTGHLAYIAYGEDRFVVSTLRCNCAEIAVSVYLNGREVDGNMQAVYVCETHGVNMAHAQRMETDADRAARAAQLDRVFGNFDFVHRGQKRKPGFAAWGVQ
jgi:hypothetical protein